MKRDANEHNLLLEALSQHFRLRSDQLTYTETIELLSIYRFIIRSHPISSLEDALEAIEALNAPTPGRSRRRRLYQTFLWCQSQGIMREGYDTKTLKPPLPVPWHENYY